MWGWSDCGLACLQNQIGPSLSPPPLPSLSKTNLRDESKIHARDSSRKDESKIHVKDKHIYVKDKHRMGNKCQWLVFDLWKHLNKTTLYQNLLQTPKMTIF